MISATLHALAAFAPPASHARAGPTGRTVAPHAMADVIVKFPRNCVATVEEAVAAVLQVQPKAMPQPALRACLRWLSEGGAPSSQAPLVDDVADASAGSASCEQSTTSAAAAGTAGGG